MGIRTHHHWRIWNEAVATPHHASFSHVTRGYNAVKNGRETPRKYAINWQGAYPTNLELRYAVSSPPPTLDGDHLNDMVLRCGRREGGKYCTRSWAFIFHIEVSSHSTCFARHCELLTSSGIILYRLHRWITVNRPLADWCSTYQPTDRQLTVDQLVPDLPTDRPSTDRWSTGARLTNR